MVTEFIEGEVYRNTQNNECFMVLAIHSQNDTKIELAVLLVDPTTYFGQSVSERVVLTKDLNNYEMVVR